MERRVTDADVLLSGLVDAIRQFSIDIP